MDQVGQLLRVLSDPTRLRIVRVLARTELNAGELRQVLGIGQSAVSGQLAQLREAGLLEERRVGRYLFVTLAQSLSRSAVGAAVLDEIADAPDDAGDLVRLADVLRRRDGDRRAKGDGGAFVPGRSWRAWSRALSWLLPTDLDVLDLGCGDGALTLELARFARSVVAVDPRPKAVAAARRRAADTPSVRVIEAPLTPVPVGAESFDLVLLSHVLHRVEVPGRLLDDARTALRPGGRLLVQELLPHDETWVRSRLGHTCLGFTPDALEALLTDAGFEGVVTERMPVPADDPFRVLIARGRRPGGDE